MAQEIPQQDHAKLTQEIDTQNVRIYNITTTVLVMVFVAWIASLIPLPNLIYSVTAIPVFAVAWVWAMVRADFLMHRAGAYLASSGLSPWETSWPRHYRKWLLVPLDLLSMSAFLFFLIWAEATIWNFTNTGWKLYVVTTAVLYLGGMGMIGFVATMFEQETKRRHATE